MQDHIVRAITKDGFLKATAICSTAIAERARQIHHTTPTATAALGRVLTAASMMGNMQKVENGTLTLQIKGGGPLGTLLAVSDAEGNVRGYVQNPGITLLEKYAGKLDVGAAVGTDGMLTVIRDLQMKEPYVGSVALVSGEIGDDVTAYFAQSEQTPTACALGVLVGPRPDGQRGGRLSHPAAADAPDALIDRLEAGIRAAGAVTPMLSEGLTPEAMLRRVLDGFELEFLENTPGELSLLLLARARDLDAHCHRPQGPRGDRRGREAHQSRVPVLRSGLYLHAGGDLGPPERDLKKLEKNRKKCLTKWGPACIIRPVADE